MAVGTVHSIASFLSVLWIDYRGKCRKSKDFLLFKLDLEETFVSAQGQAVALAEDRGLVGDQTGAVEEGAVGGAQVRDLELTVAHIQAAVGAADLHILGQGQIAAGGMPADDQADDGGEEE